MKIAFRLVTGMSAGLLLTLLAGCQAVHTEVTPAKTGLTYPPTDPASVQILTTGPAGPSIRLGQVTAEPDSGNVSKEKIEAAMRVAAAQMGANAVVIVKDTKKRLGDGSTGPWYDQSLATVNERVIVGVAIKYMTAPTRTVVTGTLSNP